MKINGIELEFYYMESETNKRFERATKSVSKKANDVENIKKLSEKIDVLCYAVKECFDMIFGVGTGVEVCGKENNLIKCMHALNELMKEKCRQDKVLSGETREFMEFLKNGISD